MDILECVSGKDNIVLDRIGKTYLKRTLRSPQDQDPANVGGTVQTLRSALSTEGGRARLRSAIVTKTSNAGRGRWLFRWVDETKAIRDPSGYKLITLEIGQEDYLIYKAKLRSAALGLARDDIVTYLLVQKPYPPAMLRLTIPKDATKILPGK
jgi:hypothetical protein